MQRRWCVTLVIVWALFAMGTPAAAQVVGATASAFHDVETMDVWVVRTFMRQQGTGIKLQASLDGYLMTFDSPLYNRGHMIGGATPALGLAFVGGSGAIAAKVGYTGVTDPNPRAGNVSMYVPLEKGVMGGADIAYQGTPRIAGLVQYFSGSSMLVTDGSAHVPVTRVGNFNLEIGAEGTWQSIDGETLWAAGPSVRLAQGGVDVGLSAGTSRRALADENVTYLRLTVNYTSIVRP